MYLLNSYAVCAIERIVGNWLLTAIQLEVHSSLHGPALISLDLCCAAKGREGKQILKGGEKHSLCS